jgi:hypothetical protein
MKRFKISLAAMAIVLGTGAAFATTNNFAPSYGFDQASSQWVPIAPHYQCNLDNTKQCTATGFDPVTGQPTGVVRGIYQVLP